MANDNRVLVIDNDLRTIKIPGSMTNIGVAGDKEVNRLYFRMPRFSGGFDLGRFDISINYFNAIGDGDIGIVDDAAIGSDKITFSWLVDEFMTLYSGAVRFSVHLEKKNGNVVEKEFNTTYAESRVLEKVNPANSIINKFPSIVEKWKGDLFDRFSGKIDSTLRYSGMAADAAVTGDKIKKLEYAVSSPYNFKGSCLYSALPFNAMVNDTYYCTDKKCRYTWNGSGWYQSSMNETDYADELSGVVDNDVFMNEIGFCTEYLSEDMFEIGNVNPDNGLEVSATNRIRSRYIRVAAGSKISINPAYRYSVSMYHSKNASGYFRGLNITNTTRFIDEDCYIRIAIGAQTEEDLNTSVYSELKLSHVGLSVKGAMDEAKSEFNTNSLLLEQGGILVAGNNVGKDTHLTTRVRTVGYLNGDLNIKCPDGVLVKYVIFYNKETLQYVSSVRPDVQHYRSTAKDGCVARIVFCKTDADEDILISDVKNNTAIEEKLSSLEVDIAAVENKALPPMVSFDFNDHDLRLDYVTDELSSFDLTYGGRSTVMEQVYSHFDELIANHPEYVSKVDAADIAGIGYPLYAIGVTSDDPTYMETPEYKTYMYKILSSNSYMNTDFHRRKKLLIISGVHGSETAAPVSAYLFAKQLCDKYLDDINLFKLRSAFDIYIIPCVNGYGIYHRTRQNANGVDINRNYPINDWKVIGVQGDHDYSGETAGSEFETQLITAITNLIEPDIAIDHHNYSYDNNWQFYVDVSQLSHLKLTYQSAVDCAIAFKKSLPEYFGSNYSIPIDKAGSAPGSLGVNLTRGSSIGWWYEHGVSFPAIVEISDNINYSGGEIAGKNDYYGNSTFAVGEYTLRNQILRYCQWVLDNSKT